MALATSIMTCLLSGERVLYGFAPKESFADGVVDDNFCRVCAASGHGYRTDVLVIQNTRTSEEIDAEVAKQGIPWIGSDKGKAAIRRSQEFAKATRVSR